MNITDVSASVVTYNNIKTIADCTKSLLKNTAGVPFSLYVYDNGSTDGTVEALSGNKDITLIKSGENKGFGYGHNAVLNIVNTKYHAFINPDIIVKDDVISRLAEYLDKNPDVAMVTPLMLNADGTPQQLPRKLPKIKYLLSGRLPFMKKTRDEYTMAGQKLDASVEIEFCSGCFMMCRTDLLKKVGGFDNRYFMYLEDADLSRVMAKQGKIILYPEIKVTHLWNRDSSHKLKYLFIHISSAIKYFKKWRTNR